MIVSELINKLSKLKQDNEIRIREIDDEKIILDLNINKIEEIKDDETEGTYYIVSYEG